MKKFFIDLGMAFAIVISASGCAGNSANTESRTIITAEELESKLEQVVSDDYNGEITNFSYDDTDYKSDGSRDYICHFQDSKWNDHSIYINSKALNL